MDRNPPASGDELTPIAGRGILADDVPTLTDDEPSDPSRSGLATHRMARGTVLGRYILLEPLGAGGMGVVYAAYDPQLDRKVALKLLRHADEGDDGSGGRARMLREAQAMARLSHPNVVAVHDVGIVDGSVFIAMEFVEGTTLTDALERAPLPWRDALALFEPAARGLAAAHEAGLVHRDFKPDNVMIGRDGRVRVMDFGLARSTAEPSVAGDSGITELSAMDRLTRTGALVGTPAYMSPELLAGGGADARSDQYAFCVALYRALFGTRPFAGDSVAALYTSATAGKLEPTPRRVLVPRWLIATVRRGLQAEPERRFPSMSDLLAALARGRRRRTRVIVGAAAVAALGLGIAGWMAPKPSVCGDGRERLAEVWNADARDAIERTLAASGLAESEAITTRVTEEIDGYGEAWSRSFRDACETNLRGEQSATLLDLRMHCLEQRRTALQATVAVLGELDRETALRAVEMVETLVPIATCEDGERLLRGKFEPDDEATRAAVADLRRRIERVKALETAGRYAAALELAEPLLAEATSLGFRPTLAELELELGQLLVDLGRPDDASKTIEQACFDAEASGHDEVAARAWALDLYVEGYKLAHREAGDMAARRAEAAALRAGDRPDLMANMLHNRAVVSLTRGEYDAALADQQAALQLRLDYLGEIDVETGNSYISIGNAYHELGRTEEALASYRKAHEILVAAVGAHHPITVTALENIASTLVASGQAEQARAVLHEVLGILQDTLGPDHPRVGQVLFNLGWVDEMLGDHEGALASFAKARALELARVAPTHPMVAEYDASMGVVAYKLGRYDEARGHLQSALATFEAAKGPKHNHVARVLNDLALVEKAEGDRAAALAYHRRALAIRREALPAAHPELLGSIENLARLFVELERFGDAAPLAAELLAVAEQHRDDELESYVDAIVLSAEIAVGLGERRRALTLLDGASERLVGRDPEALAALAKARAAITGASG